MLCNPNGASGHGGASTSGPPLSVVIAARDAWPSARDCLDALHPQVADVGGELIAAIQPRAAPPDRDVRYPGVLWIEGERGSVFQLRARALERARGRIVAFTEDHAWVAAGWCRAILEAHAEHPEAVAIGGVVENGATRSLIDWASFFISSGPFMSPIRAGATDRISLQANVSYKREALPQTLSESGIMQLTFHRDLARQGKTLLADPRLVVIHDQRMSLTEHCRSHFHNGRSIASFRLETMALRERLLRILGTAALPAVMLARTVAAVAGKRRETARLVAAVPVIAWMLAWHAAGELAGYVAGPGSSPAHVN